MRCTDLCDDEYNASPRALAGGKFSAGKTLAALTLSFFTFRPYHLGHLRCCGIFEIRGH